MDVDYKFLQDIFKRFSPAQSSSDGKKLSKRPVFKGWLDVTEEQSAELARHADYRDGPFMFLMGKAAKYFTVDLDVKDISRKDHVNKIDGMQYWEDNFCEPDHMNTLIIKTPSGGRHLVYKYQDGIKSGQLEKDVLIDILSDGKAIFFGPGYEILNRANPIQPPQKLVQQIIYNINYGSQQIITTNNNNALALDKNTTQDYSASINAISNCNVKWDVIPSDDNQVFTIIPHTAICTVDDTYVHSEEKHSRFVVTKDRVVARCFSHKTQRTVTGAVSRQLRELFFPTRCRDPFDGFMNDLIELCSRNGWVRFDGYVWQARQRQPWIYDRYLAYDDFINTKFKSHQAFMKNTKKFFDVVKYMEVVDHEGFPFMKKNVDMLGFNNCVINLVTYEVFDANTWDRKSVPRHNIDGDFSWDNIHTPLFDSIIKYQLESDDVYEYFLAFIGRLFYNIKRFDNYNIVPLIKGDTGTGKSTVITIIKRLFAPGAVGVLNSNNETTFGLEAKHDKELLIAHEIGDRFTDRLASDLFKQMVCGEDINIPRKNKPAIDVTWSVPMFLCSNIHLAYNDCMGSISRRLAIFKFDKYVPQKDVTLEARIIDTELPAIVAKCLLAYCSMVKHVDANSFWDACPTYFHDNNREMSEETDYIFMFLTLPPGDNVYRGKDVYFRECLGSTMLLQDFRNKFINYMRFRHPNVKYRWTSDYSAFNKLGYRVVRQNVCKGCGSHAEQGCCSQYSAANRSRRHVIENIMCVEREVLQDSEL